MYGNNNDPYRNPQQSPYQQGGSYPPAPRPYPNQGQEGVLYDNGQYGEHALYQDQRYEGDLSDPAVLSFAKKVYAYFGSALLVAAGGALGGTVYAEQQIAAGNPGAVSTLWIGALVVFFASYLIVLFTRKSRSPLKTGLLYIFASAAGVTLAPLLAHMVGAGMGMTIVIAFGIASVTFFGVTVYVMTTNKDFRSLGGYLFIGLLILLGAIIMSFVVPFPSTLVQVICIAGFALFVGYTLYDTSTVTRDYFFRQDAVTPAMLLLFNFIMLFRYALLLLGRD
jgi:FtsH-binding integral membrane protein